MTAFGSIETAVDAMKRGAEDFITKPVDPDLLRLLVARAIERRARSGASRCSSPRRSRGRCRRSWASPPRSGASAPRRSASPRPTRPCCSKERAARARSSSRAPSTRSRARATGRSSRSTARRFPDTLLESELFGHERGAFTGAAGRRLGQVRARRRRHGVPGRDRRADGRDTGQAPARAPGEVLPPRRRDVADPGRRADRRGFEPAARGARRAGRLPRGSLLPGAGLPDPHPAAARAAGGHRSARRLLPAASCRRSSGKKADDSSTRSPRAAARLRVAGQRPRAAQLSREGHHSRRGQRHRDAPPAPVPEAPTPLPRPATSRSRRSGTARRSRRKIWLARALDSAKGDRSAAAAGARADGSPLRGEAAGARAGYSNSLSLSSLRRANPKLSLDRSRAPGSPRSRLLGQRGHPRRALPHRDGRSRRRGRHQGRDPVGGVGFPWVDRAPSDDLRHPPPAAPPWTAEGDDSQRGRSARTNGRFTPGDYRTARSASSESAARHDAAPRPVGSSAGRGERVSLDAAPHDRWTAGAPGASSGLVGASPRAVRQGDARGSRRLGARAAPEGGARGHDGGRRPFGALHDARAEPPRPAVLELLDARRRRAVDGKLAPRPRLPGPRAWPRARPG